MEDALSILRENKLKITPLREAVLLELIASKKGLSQQDLNQLLRIAFDRSTLFRTLNTLEKKGILHKIIDEEGIAKYAFTQQQKVNIPSDHAHFYCIRCKNIFCLDYSVTLARIPVPDGFQKQGVELQVRGICIKCSSKKIKH
jgi:Fur family ferric uptake transcriptional regulator